MYRLVQYTDFHSLVSCLIHSTNTSNKVGALAYAALIAVRQKVLVVLSNHLSGESIKNMLQSRSFSSLQSSITDAVASLIRGIYVSVISSMLPSFSLLVGLSRNCQWCNNEITGNGKASFLLDTHLTLPLMTMSLRFGLLGTRWLTSLSLLQCSITYTTFHSEFILRN